METIRLTETAPGLDFETALARAKQVAAARKEDPMLMAWYDEESGRFSPTVTCCGGEDEPAYVCYARSRGADLKVEAEGGKYVFYFR
jgi:hypothetical protein